MKKVILLLLLIAACRKAEVAEPAHPAAPAVKSPVTTTPPVAAPSADYGKAIDWARSAPSFRFDMTIGDVKASGDLERAHVGEERLRFKAKGEEWSAERHRKGVSWTRNGKAESNEPAYADRIYQWITMVPDPEKSPVQVAGKEGDATHFRFMNLNTNETHDAWVRDADNHLVRLKTSGAGTAFPAVEITIHD